MTIPQNPRVFDLSTSTSVKKPGAGHPALDRVFWHGTCMSRLDGILREGLIPSKSHIGHTCLSADPAMALFYARLGQTLEGNSSGREPVLIRIDGASLDPEAVCTETGTLDIGAYGRLLPGRSRSDLALHRGNWQGLLRASDAMGYTAPIPITEQMVEYRTRDLPALPINQIIEENDTGICKQKEAIHILAEIEQELALPAVA
jgi:hypothetical protein